MSAVQPAAVSAPPTQAEGQKKKKVSKAERQQLKAQRKATKALGQLYGENGSADKVFSHQVETQVDTQIGRKIFYSVLAAVVLIGVYYLIDFEIAKNTSLSSSLPAIGHLLEKVGTSPGVFVIGVLAAGALYAAGRIYRYVMDHKNPVLSTLYDRLTNGPQKEDHTVRNWVKGMIVTLVVVVVVAVAIFKTVDGSSEAVEKFFSKWDQPEVIVPGLIVGGGMIGLVKWVLWLKKKEGVEEELNKLLFFEVPADSPPTTPAPSKVTPIERVPDDVAVAHRVTEPLQPPRTVEEMFARIPDGGPQPKGPEKPKDASKS